MDYKITLTDEQMQQLIHSPVWPVPVCDTQGTVVGTLDPERSPAFIAEMKRRAATAKVWYTAEQVENHLRALEEAWQREGPFDETRMRELLKDIRAAEAQ
jgi:hypothetical protein